MRTSGMARRPRAGPVRAAGGSAFPCPRRAFRSRHRSERRWGVQWRVVRKGGACAWFLRQHRTADFAHSLPPFPPAASTAHSEGLGRSPQVPSWSVHARSSDEGRASVNAGAKARTGVRAFVRTFSIAAPHASLGVRKPGQRRDGTKQVGGGWGNVPQVRLQDSSGRTGV